MDLDEFAMEQASREEKDAYWFWARNSKIWIFDKFLNFEIFDLMGKSQKKSILKLIFKSVSDHYLQCLCNDPPDTLVST